jgi:hypothetical protein
MLSVAIKALRQALPAYFIHKTPVLCLFIALAGICLHWAILYRNETGWLCIHPAYFRLTGVSRVAAKKPSGPAASDLLENSRGPQLGNFIGTGAILLMANLGVAPFASL